MFSRADNIGIKVTEEFGFFIEIEGCGEDKEYFVEPNTIVDECFEPIGDNFGVKFEDFEELKRCISMYLENNHFAKDFLAKVNN